MKVIFVGTPEIAIPTYKALHESHQIVAVLTQTDKSVGRSKTLVPSPICQAAEVDNVPVYKADKISLELTETLKNLQADIFVTFAYGVILPKDFLEITKYGGINIHPSLLPQLRGPSPMQTAILKGLPTGLTVQQIAYKVDSGDILYQENIELTDEQDIFDLTEIVSVKAGSVILKVLDSIANSTVRPIPQIEENATFCKMINKDDGHIDWNDSVVNILNKIRAFAQWPVAYSMINGQKILFYKAKTDMSFDPSEFQNAANGQFVIMSIKKGIYIKCKDGLLKIQKLQLQNKKILDDMSFANGGQKFLNMVLE